MYLLVIFRKAARADSGREIWRELNSLCTINVMRRNLYVFATYFRIMSLTTTRPSPAVNLENSEPRISPRAFLAARAAR